MYCANEIIHIRDNTHVDMVTSSESSNEIESIDNSNLSEDNHTNIHKYNVTESLPSTSEKIWSTQNSDLLRLAIHHETPQ